MWVKNRRYPGPSPVGRPRYLFTQGIAIMDFMQSWPFMIIMAVLLVGLIGVFIMQRNKRDDD